MQMGFLRQTNRWTANVSVLATGAEHDGRPAQGGGHGVCTLVTGDPEVHSDRRLVTVILLVRTRSGRQNLELA